MVDILLIVAFCVLAFTVMYGVMSFVSYFDLAPLFWALGIVGAGLFILRAISHAYCVAYVTFGPCMAGG